MDLITKRYLGVSVRVTDDTAVIRERSLQVGQQVPDRSPVRLNL